MPLVPCSFCSLPIYHQCIRLCFQVVGRCPRGGAWVASVAWNGEIRSQRGQTRARCHQSRFACCRCKVAGEGKLIQSMKNACIPCSELLACEWKYSVIWRFFQIFLSYRIWKRIWIWSAFEMGSWWRRLRENRTKPKPSLSRWTRRGNKPEKKLPSRWGRKENFGGFERMR